MGRVDKTRQNALPLGRFARKFAARAVRGGPKIAAFRAPPHCERGAEIVDSKLRPGPSAPEEPCDGNRGE